MGVGPAGIILSEGKSPPDTGHILLPAEMYKLPPLDNLWLGATTLKHFGTGHTEMILELKPS